MGVAGIADGKDALQLWVVNLWPAHGDRLVAIFQGDRLGRYDPNPTVVTFLKFVDEAALFGNEHFACRAVPLDSESIVSEAEPRVSQQRGLSLERGYL